MEVFDFVKDLSFTKNNLFTPETEGSYVPFIVNRAFSYHSDCIFHVQELNKYNPPKNMHHQYLFFAIPKRKRFSPWHKLKVEPIVEVLQRVYNYSLPRAIEASKVLSEEQQKQFLKEHDTGGEKRK